MHKSLFTMDLRSHSLYQLKKYLLATSIPTACTSYPVVVVRDRVPQGSGTRAYMDVFTARLERPQADS